MKTLTDKLSELTTRKNLASIELTIIKGDYEERERYLQYTKEEVKLLKERLEKAQASQHNQT